MFRKICIIIGILLMIVGAYSLSIDSIPTPTNYLNDYSGTLTIDQISQLNSQLKQVSDDSNIEIGVWLIDSTEGKPISDYALELGNKFGVGNKGRYDGLVILVAIKDREYFVSTAKGAETMWTDIEVRDIELKDFDPNFKKGDFYTGLSLAITDFSNVKNNEDLPINLGNPLDSSALIFWIILICIVVFLIIIIADDSGGFTGGIIGGTLGSSSGRSSGRSSGGNSSGGSFGGSSGGGFGGFGGGGGFSGGGAGGRF